MTDFSQPCRVVRDYLCRRYGVKNHKQYGLQYEGTGKSCVIELYRYLATCILVVSVFKHSLALLQCREFVRQYAYYVYFQIRVNLEIGCDCTIDAVVSFGLITLRLLN